MKRRTVLLSMLPAIVTSGCIRFGQRARSLGVKTAYIEQIQHRWKLEAEVSVESRDAEREWATFHDVKLIGYDTDDEIICSKNLGRIAPGETKTVNVTCDRIPPLLTFTAEDGACAADTSIGVYEYRGESEGVDYHRRRLRECGGARLPTKTVEIE